MHVSFCFWFPQSGSKKKMLQCYGSDQKKANLQALLNLKLIKHLRLRGVSCYEGKSRSGGLMKTTLLVIKTSFECRQIFVRKSKFHLMANRLSYFYCYIPVIESVNPDLPGPAAILISPKAQDVILMNKT